MLRSRFLWKLYAGYVVLILMTSVLIGLLSVRRFEQTALEEAVQNLRSKAVLLQALATPVLVSPDAGFQQHLTDVGGNTDTRLTVIAADGTVIADSQNDPARMNNHGDRFEVLEALAKGEGHSTRLSETMSARMMYFALPVKRDGALLGYVRTALSLERIDAHLAALRWWLVLGTAGAAVLALVLGFVFAQRVTGPLASMRVAASAIAGGDYSRKIARISRDEIGELSSAFNAMGEQLQERMQTILTDRNRVLAILGSMVEGVVAVDRSERIVHLNSVAAGLFGLDAAQAIGREIHEAVRVRILWETLAKTMKEGTEVSEEFKLEGRPRQRVLELHAAPLRDAEGTVAGAVAVLHDVTELRRLEDVRRDFVANVSHELKTPLTAIRGLVETLIDDPQMPGETRERFLAKVNDQTRRLSAIVTDLLTLSRVESRPDALERVALDLCEPVRASLRALQPSCEAKRIAAVAELPDVAVRVQGDPEALRQVFDNLLDNAIKYTPEGGRVAVRLSAANGHAWVEVQDSGIGIEPEHRDRIFERFYRVDKARSRELGGTGLGLSIVKHLVLAHGGQVSVVSELGKGSTFRVELPALPPGAQAVTLRED
ncbi:MAG: cell wall metabolism sensor histidine kinase WalK [Planctomycetes bacterium]|nr:cell wall metabolism sensor histidine kinase WalK [Planctomycetota bacterium]